MVTLEQCIRDLESLQTTLESKTNLLNSSFLSDDNASVTELHSKLVVAIETLSAGIKELKGYMATMNNNKKWN